MMTMILQSDDGARQSANGRLHAGAVKTTATQVAEVTVREIVTLKTMAVVKMTGAVVAAAVGVVVEKSSRR